MPSEDDARPLVARELIVMRYRTDNVVLGLSEDYILDSDRSEDVRAVLQECDGSATLTEIADKCKLAISEVRDLVGKLRVLGILDTEQELDVSSPESREAFSFLKRLGVSDLHNYKACSIDSRAFNIPLHIMAEERTYDAAIQMAKLVRSAGFTGVIATSRITDIQTSVRLSEEGGYVVIIYEMNERNCRPQRSNHDTTVRGGCVIHVGVNWDGGYYDIEATRNRAGLCRTDSIDNARADVSRPVVGINQVPTHVIKRWVAEVAIAIMRELYHGERVKDMNASIRHQISGWQEYMYTVTSEGLQSESAESSVSQIRNQMAEISHEYEQILSVGSQRLGDAGANDRVMPEELSRSRHGRQVVASYERIVLQQTMPPSVVPSMELGRDGSRGRPSRLDLNRLSTLLQWTAGVHSDSKEGATRRVAANAGNLGSVDLFVIVRDVYGIRPGTYLYHAEAHVLLQINHDGEGKSATAITAIMGRQKHKPKALIVASGALYRLTPKYGLFGYSLVNMDAGVAFSQLRSVAASGGTHTWIPQGWSDWTAHKLLGLEPLAEVCTAVVALGKDDADEADRGNEQLREQVASGEDGASQEEVECGWRGKTLLGRLITASRVDHGKEPADRWIKRLASERKIERKSKHAERLIKDNGKRVDITKRASLRVFSSRPVHVDQILRWCIYADALDQQEWGGRPWYSKGLTFAAEIRNGAGIRNGNYVINPSLSTGASAAKVSEELSTLDMMPQWPTQLVPVTIFILGARSRAQKEEAIDHRMLYMRAGAASNRILLAARMDGASGCIVGGVNRVLVKQVFMRNGRRDLCMCGVVLGYEE